MVVGVGLVVLPLYALSLDPKPERAEEPAPLNPPPLDPKPVVVVMIE